MGGNKKQDATPWFSRDPQQFTVKELGKCILNGSFGLVGFQRDSVWEPSDRLSFFHSLFLGVPVGVVYAWTVRKKDTLSPRTGKLLQPHPARGFYSFEENFANGDNAEFLILDGQQRLTSLGMLRASITDASKLKPVIVNLKELNNVNSKKAFVFGDQNGLSNLHQDEIHLQNLLSLGSTKFSAQNTIQTEYQKYIPWLYDTFTDRPIPVQVLESWIENNDALHVFITVNKAGKELNNLDLAESILRAHWQDLSVELEELIQFIQEIYWGSDKKSKTIKKASYVSFTKEGVLRCVLYDLFGSNAYGTLLSKNTLGVYSSTLKNGKPLSEEALKSSFNKIKKASLSLKEVLEKRLYLGSTKGIAPYSIINGIQFFTRYKGKNDGPSEKEIGEIIVWIIVSSYYTHWNFRSPQTRLDETLALMSEKNVDWNKLCKHVIKYPDNPERVEEVKKKQGFSLNTLNLADLIPRSGDKLYYGVPHKKASKGHPFQLLIEYTLPKYFASRDWRTGNRIADLDFNQRSKHHIFPQKKFNDDFFVNALSQATLLGEQIDISTITSCPPENVDSLGSVVKSALNLAISDVMKTINQINSSKSSNPQTQKKNAQKLDEMNETITLYTKAKSATNFSSKEEIVDLIHECAPWWYQFGVNPKNLKERLGNIAVVTQNSNSSVGAEWPLESVFHRYGKTHPDRIKSYFIPMSDENIFSPEKYIVFCEKREDTFLEKMNEMLENFIQGDFNEIYSSKTELPMIERIKNDSGELNIERKSTMLYCVNNDQFLKGGGYLLSTIVRACVSFANCGGGTVVVGIDDKGAVLGLSKDLEYLTQKYPEKNPFDKWLEILKNGLKETNPILNYTISPHEHEGEIYVSISIEGLIKPCYQKKYKRYQKPQRTRVYWGRYDGSTEEFVLTKNKRRVKVPANSDSGYEHDGVFWLEHDGMTWSRINSGNPWELVE